jgi:hypothetical protein
MTTSLIDFCLVYAMAQLSKAVIPRDDGGPFGQRIGLSVGGGKGWALRAVAFRTGRSSSAEWIKYTIAVLNCAWIFALGARSRTTHISRCLQGMIVRAVDGIHNQLGQPSTSGVCR